MTTRYSPLLLTLHFANGMGEFHDAVSAFASKLLQVHESLYLEALKIT